MGLLFVKYSCNEDEKTAKQFLYYPASNEVLDIRNQKLFEDSDDRVNHIYDGDGRPESCPFFVIFI